MSKSNRDLKMHIDDILESIEAIESYVSDIGSFDGFASDRKTYSATIREYIIIGEAILPIISLLESKFAEFSSHDRQQASAHIRKMADTLELNGVRPQLKSINTIMHQ
ncbi:MAG: DUF86 domain-containing protein [Desulfobacteraceae bacterium]|nr:DUF86 domain-containing protein [Desulfobacteraceae bacterium]